MAPRGDRLTTRIPFSISFVPQAQHKKQQARDAERIRQHAAAVKRDREAQLKKRREREAAARQKSHADYQRRVKRQNDESSRLQGEVKAMRERELESIQLLQKPVGFLQSTVSD